MGREEQGRTWCMDAAQLDTQRKKEEAILKPARPLLDHPVEFLNSTGQASTRSSWKSTVKPEKCCFPLDFPFDPKPNPLVYANSIESVNRRLGRARFHTGRKRTQRVQEEPEVLVTDTMDVPEGNGNPLGNGLGRARQTRPIGLGDAPNRHQQRQGIVPPPVQNHNFEIKLGMINLINGVSEDAIKLRLFPMSLADKAHQWEKSLPHGTITTWDECKKAFLAKFFSTGRTAKLRSEISSFIRGTMRHLLRLGRVDDGWQLVENIANSNGSYGEEYDRTNRSSTPLDRVR
ncbi:unnamed protein product [Microthlaspi erraticum]|uniref:Retrotransposon gag domain-containing protein n=1 Tax=Microthlaspi erraticum TaxID=1685480 RepID=A0A6D2JXI3_9BRAS|nr:unnamed protein product [Microthlaspi erraticum]